VPPSAIAFLGGHTQNKRQCDAVKATKKCLLCWKIGMILLEEVDALRLLTIFGDSVLASKLTERLFIVAVRLRRVCIRGIIVILSSAAHFTLDALRDLGNKRDALCGETYPASFIQ
jgi:hypothetical protein